jgi:hypothetical protein
MHSSNSKLTVEANPSAETWSVSRTSDLFLVGLLLPILATESLRLSRHLVVGHGADGAAPILLAWPQSKGLCRQFGYFLLQVFHAFFKRLRHAGNILHCAQDRHKEIRNQLDLGCWDTTSSANMNTKKFPGEVIRKLKWYVYLYFGPRKSSRNRRPFYVGKGAGNRAFSQLRHSLESKKVEPKRVKRIAEIQESGEQPEIEILRYGLTETQAYLLEPAVIDCIGLDHLTNEIRGRHSGSFGRVTIKDVLLTMSAPRARIRVPCVLITINNLYRSEMNPNELKEATRGIWRVGCRREKAEFAMAVFQGVMRQVYRIDRWLPASTRYKTRDTAGFVESRRFEFEGNVARGKSKNYVGKSVRHLVRQGSQNPIRYVDC